AMVINGKTVFGARPHAIPIHQNREDVIVRQAVRGGEVLETKARQRLRCGSRSRRAMGTLRSGSGLSKSRRRKEHEHRYQQHNCSSALGYVLPHRVLKYSIRSLSSSLVRSLVRPCLSSGL